MRFDIGIVPLADSDFNDCKSCLKGMELAACGIPFVASPTREYLSLHERWNTDSAGPHFCLADNDDPEAWGLRLDDLLAQHEQESPVLRKLAAGQDLSFHWVEWALAYKEVYQCTRV